MSGSIPLVEHLRGISKFRSFNKTDLALSKNYWNVVIINDSKTSFMKIVFGIQYEWIAHPC